MFLSAGVHQLCGSVRNEFLISHKTVPVITTSRIMNFPFPAKENNERYSSLPFR